MLTDAMNLFDLTITQLKRATAIKEKIDTLNNELRNIISVEPVRAAIKAICVLVVRDRHVKN